MPWQEWREHRLWNLDIDDLFKANSAGVHKIYLYFKTGPHTQDRAGLSLENVCKLMPLGGFDGPENEQNASYAYVLSK